MGFVTNDPKKADDQLPGDSGLTVDLGLRACPQCRREVPEWETRCPDCGVTPVPKAELPSAMPAVPAHLLADDDEDSDDENSEDSEDQPDG